MHATFHDAYVFMRSGNNVGPGCLYINYWEKFQKQHACGPFLGNFILNVYDIFEAWFFR